MMDNVAVVCVSCGKDAAACERRILKYESIKSAVIHLRLRPKNASFDEEDLRMC